MEVTAAPGPWLFERLWEGWVVPMGTSEDKDKVTTCSCQDLYPEETLS
jgi:hypothetical protein